MSGPVIPDTDVDYLTERAELRLSDCVQRISVGDKELHGRYLSHAEAHAETDSHPVVAPSEPIAGLLCAFALILCGLAILLAGVVIGHLFLLPDATIWPMAVASLICAAAAFVVAAAGLRAD